MRVGVPDVEALHLGLDAVLLDRAREREDVVERVGEHEVERELLLGGVPLRVVHRAHVERRDRRALREVMHAFGHRPGTARRPVDEDGAAGPGLRHDAPERVLRPRRRTVVVARVDVDDRGARFVGATRLFGDLDRRVRDRRAVLLGGDGAGERAGQDDFVVGRGRHGDTFGSSRARVKRVRHGRSYSVTVRRAVAMSAGRPCVAWTSVRRTRDTSVRGLGVGARRAW